MLSPACRCPPTTMTPFPSRLRSAAATASQPRSDLSACRVSSTLPGRREPRSARSAASRRPNRRLGMASSTAKPYSSCESVLTSRSCLRHAVDPLLGVHAPLKRSPPAPWTLSEDLHKSSTPPSRPLLPLPREFPRELTLGRLARHATLEAPEAPLPKELPLEHPHAPRPSGPPRPAPPTPALGFPNTEDRQPIHLDPERRVSSRCCASATEQLLVGSSPTGAVGSGPHNVSPLGSPLQARPTPLAFSALLVPWCPRGGEPGKSRSRATPNAQAAGPSKP